MAKVAVIAVSSVFLVAMVVAAAVGITKYQSDQKGSVSQAGSGGNNGITTSQKAVSQICAPTDYKETCEKSLSNANTTDPKELIKTGFRAAVTEIEKVLANSSLGKELANDPMSKEALKNCHEILNYAIDDLNRSLDELGDQFDMTKLSDYIIKLKLWLGGTLAYQQSCIDEFANSTAGPGLKMKELLTTAREITSNGLAMVSDISGILRDLGIPNIGDLSASASDDSAANNAERRLLSEDASPGWIDSDERRLLQQAPDAINPNVVVALDGSGKYKSINQALLEVPKNNPTRFIIYIKAGVYEEQVLVGKSMTNVMFIGDGPTKTKITGRLNYIDGTGTFRTATVGVVGEGFMAKDIGFENSAGAIKHQAVALRVQGDRAIFFNCQIDGYQDTLYAHSHRQYYRDCTISGTIDFIFGDASAVLQNCKIIVRKPLENQQCIVTAQGRTNHREISGIVLHNCVISGDPEYLPVKEKNKAYLGRPWKEFSKTIIMQSQIDDIIAPEGFLPWNGNFALDTLYYAEFGNRGPGADQSRRVTWKGIHKINTNIAHSYTPQVFLVGNQWIPQSGVPYTPGMFPGL